MALKPHSLQRHIEHIMNNAHIPAIKPHADALSSGLGAVLNVAMKALQDLMIAFNTATNLIPAVALPVITAKDSVYALRDIKAKEVSVEDAAMMVDNQIAQVLSAIRDVEVEVTDLKAAIAKETDLAIKEDMEEDVEYLEEGIQYARNGTATAGTYVDIGKNKTRTAVKAVRTTAETNVAKELEATLARIRNVNGELSIANLALTTVVATPSDVAEKIGNVTAAAGNVKNKIAEVKAALSDVNDLVDLANEIKLKSILISSVKVVVASIKLEADAAQTAINDANTNVANAVQAAEKVQTFLDAKRATESKLNAAAATLNAADEAANALPSDTEAAGSPTPKKDAKSAVASARSVLARLTALLNNAAAIENIHDLNTSLDDGGEFAKAIAAAKVVIAAADSTHTSSPTKAPATPPTPPTGAPGSSGALSITVDMVKKLQEASTYVAMHTLSSKYNADAISKMNIKDRKNLVNEMEGYTTFLKELSSNKKGEGILCFNPNSAAGAFCKNQGLPKQKYEVEPAKVFFLKPSLAAPKVEGTATTKALYDTKEVMCGVIKDVGTTFAELKSALTPDCGGHIDAEVCGQIIANDLLWGLASECHL